MTPVMLIDVEIAACDVARDGELIRTLTRDNFYEAMKASWDEARHQREPLQPERYRMLRRAGETLGFFALRHERDHLYVQTIQLVPSARRRGLGARVMDHIAQLAAEVDLCTIPDLLTYPAANLSGFSGELRANLDQIDHLRAARLGKPDRFGSALAAMSVP